MRDITFYQQAELLLEMLPLVAKHKVFALKGGTAINFFVRDCSEARLNIDSKRPGKTFPSVPQRMRSKALSNRATPMQSTAE